MIIKPFLNIQTHKCYLKIYIIKYSTKKQHNLILYDSYYLQSMYRVNNTAVLVEINKL